MSGQPYSTEILISAKPESIYKAITKDIDKWAYLPKQGKWWTELSKQAVQIGDKLTIRFENTSSWVKTVSGAFSNRPLVWKVVAVNQDLDELVE